MKPLTRFWLFIYSMPNIVGCFLGIAGLSMYFTGLIKSYWPAIVTGLYLLGYIAWPRNKHIDLKMSDQMQVEAIETELDNLVKKIHKRVLPETRDKIESIARLVIDLLPRVKNDPRHRHVLVQTAVDYLPSMLEHYLNLPAAFARFHPLQNGKTARQLLIEQLTLMEEQLQNIARDIYTGDTDALLAHSRFLNEKFGSDKTWEIQAD